MFREPSARFARKLLIFAAASVPLWAGCGQINANLNGGGVDFGTGSSSSGSGSGDAKPASAQSTPAASSSEPEKKYLGKVTVGTKPLSKGGGQATGTFKPGDHLYARLDVPKTLREAAKALPNRGLTVYVAINIDGQFDQQPRHFTLQPGAPEIESDGISVELIADPATTQRPTMSASIAGTFAELEPKMHELEIIIGAEMTGMSKWDGAGATKIKFDATGGTDKVTAQQAALVKKATEISRMPKAAHKDAGLEKAMLAAIGAAGWKEKPLRAVIVEPDWSVFRNEVTGILLSRTIQGYVAVKREDGTCSEFFINFVQQHQGGAWGKTLIESVYDNDDMLCENVNK
jgi:hypothetical protein